MLFLDRIKKFLGRRPRKNVQNWYLRGLEAAKEKKEEDAVRYFNRAIRGVQAFRWDDEKEIEEGLKAFDSFLEKHDNDHISWRSKGELLNVLERYEEALECFEKAITVKPNDPRSWRNKGLTLFALHEFEEAINSFDKALSLDPNDTQSQIEKGNILSATGDHLGAIDSLDIAMKNKNLQTVDGEAIQKQTDLIEKQISGRIQLKKKESWRNPKSVEDIIRSGHPLFLGRNIKFLFLIKPPLESWRQPTWVKSLRKEIPPKLSNWYRDINVWYETPTKPYGYEITPEGIRWMQISIECLNPTYEIALPYSKQFFTGMLENYVVSVKEAFSNFNIDCKFYKFYFFRRNPFTEKAILEEKSTIPAPNLNKIINKHRDNSIYETIFSVKHETKTESKNEEE